MFQKPRNERGADSSSLNPAEWNIFSIYFSLRLIVLAYTSPLRRKIASTLSTRRRFVQFSFFGYIQIFILKSSKLSKWCTSLTKCLILSVNESANIHYAKFNFIKIIHHAIKVYDFIYQWYSPKTNQINFVRWRYFCSRSIPLVSANSKSSVNKINIRM